jgi:serine/threonine protein kinase
MLGEFGEVLVVDWGQAIDLTQPESVRPGGTPAYISPEMATYWCDTYLDKVPDSPAKADVGPRSDVYQLGAILFECVTGDLLRQGSDGETPYDVIRRACHNDMVSHDSFLNDELMKIARRALRVSESDHIETIDELLLAIREFETRALSIELRKRADQLLADAKSEKSYDDFQKARFGYEESIEKWQDNALAHRGLGDAKLSCAEHALTDQNFELGIDVIATPQTKAEKEVHQRLISGKRLRDRRKLLVRYLALGLVSSIIVGLGINAYLFYENAKALKLRDLAVAEKAEIEAEIPALVKKANDKENELAELSVKVSMRNEKNLKKRMPQI